MDALKPSGSPVPLESVLCTEELQRRPSRPPDYHAENQALLALAQELTNSPGHVLQALVDVALELCRGHSAGISLLEEGPPGGLNPGGDHFRWHAVAGQWAPLVWNTTTPRDFGPCGTVLDRNTTLLFSNAHRYDTQFAGVLPLLVEGLLVPFSVNGHAVGIVWVIAHDETRRFDAEDRRLLESLATFAATAYQARLTITALAKANEHLQAGIAERQRAEAALREADRAKDEFLAMLGHELRNPLGTLGSSLQLIKTPDADAATVSGAWDVMHRQVQHMARLVDDLLDVARVTQTQIDLRRDILDLKAIVRRAIDAFEPTVAARAQTLTLSMKDDEPLYVEADPTRMEQVFGNLLNNASKFSSEKGRVWVSVEADSADSVIVRVRDDGIGIAPEMLPRVFDLFAQADRSPARARGGLGIGLTIVQRIVQLHGGRVEARSAGLDQGSEFLVHLPRIRVPVPRTTDDRLASPPSAGHDTVRRRVLVVEDNPDGAETLARLLQVYGHDVRTAVDGATALEAAVAFRPEIVLLDIGLPGMSGHEVAAQLRRIPGIASALLVAVTGYGQAEDRDRSRQAGFDAHWTKPVDHDALLRLIQSLPQRR
jgi:signal transduction histidine kinase/CheY-like chemotaxis protein